jgi:hypothetical protein
VLRGFLGGAEVCGQLLGMLLYHVTDHLPSFANGFPKMRDAILGISVAALSSALSTR